jgi:hypothetical protein
MQNMSNVGSGVQSGLQHSPQTLERLRPYQIAMRMLPTASVTVMEASDEQFQALVDAHGILINDEIAEWSFDDRCRFINHKRKQGVDLFVLPNKNSSETIQDGELFVAPEPAPQVSAPQKRLITFADYEAVKKQLGWVTETVQEPNENNS